MNLYEEVEKIKASGYNEQNAQSKLGQDIVLKAIADSGMARNATIKGGVVMRSISGNARRATQDLDLDFIKYSISDDSIRRFVERLRNSITRITRGSAFISLSPIRRGLPFLLKWISACIRIFP